MLKRLLILGLGIGCAVAIALTLRVATAEAASVSCGPNDAGRHFTTREDITGSPGWSCPNAGQCKIGTLECNWDCVADPSGSHPVNVTCIPSFCSVGPIYCCPGSGCR